MPIATWGRTQPSLTQNARDGTLLYWTRSIIPAYPDTGVRVYKIGSR